MPNVVLRGSMNFEIFRKVRPEFLLSWLEPAREYLAKRGVILPEGIHGSGDYGTMGPSDHRTTEGGLVGPLAPAKLDYDALVKVFMEPTVDMPSWLVDGLHLVREMGRSRHVGTMLEAAAANGLQLGVTDEDTPEEIALRLLMADERLLEDLQSRREVTRARAFQYFVTDASPVPRFDGPTLEQIRALEERVGEFYAALHGAKGTRVFPYCQQRVWHDAPEWLFLVRHGVRPKREEAMENGEPTCVFFRPRKHAVLKYDTLRGEMGVWCETPKEQRVLLKHFGRCLFGRPDFFPIGSKFDLSPLPKLGRGVLVFRDVPGIEDVRLTELELCQRQTPWNRTVRQADDVFRLMEEQDVKWPKDLNEITKATFTMRLWKQKRPRRISILPSNRAIYTRDEDSWIYERWMEARGIVKAVQN